MNNYLYVIDFCQGKIFEIELDETDKEIVKRGGESYPILKRRGLKASQCHWMYSKDKLFLETIEII